MKRYLLLILLVFVAITPVQAQTAPLQVLTTTTIIADIARNVGGELVDVTSLVPADADIHAFQPVPQDVARVADTDLVLINGAGLEGFLSGLIENAADVQVITISDGIEVLPFGDEHEAEDEEEHADDEHIGVLGVDTTCEESAESHAEDEHDHGACDPHFWTDPNNVMIWAGNIAEAFAAADPANAETYRTNAEAYQAELSALDSELQTLVDSLPEDQRIIVTNHEFLAYFAHHYGFEIVGTVIPSVSTLAEPSPQDVAALIETVRAEGVQAIFAEVSDPGRLAQIVAADSGDIAVVSLYSDSLSSADGPAPTYLDYLRYNVEAIVNALR